MLVRNGIISHKKMQVQYYNLTEILNFLWDMFQLHYLAIFHMILQ